MTLDGIGWVKSAIPYSHWRATFRIARHRPSSTVRHHTKNRQHEPKGAIIDALNCYLDVKPVNSEDASQPELNLRVIVSTIGIKRRSRGYSQSKMSKSIYRCLLATYPE